MAMRVLVLGGSGNLGKLVLQQLLQRDILVRAIVRPTTGLPASLVDQKNLTVVKANLLDLSVDELTDHLRDCNAVICTLGHSLNYGRVPALGIWMNPHELVVNATRMVCESIVKAKPQIPIKFILLNTVGVANPDGTDPHTRSGFENGMVSLMNASVPPYSDSVKSAQYISKQVGPEVERYLEWTTVRPDGFVDGDVSEYTIHDGIRHPFYKPEVITKSNIAHFMCELVEDPQAWAKWKFKMPVIVDSHQPGNA